MSKVEALKSVAYRLPQSEVDLFDEFCSEHKESKTHHIRMALLSYIARAKAPPGDWQQSLSAMQTQIEDLRLLVKSQGEALLQIGATAVLSSAMLRDDFSGSEQSERALERHLFAAYEEVALSLKAREMMMKAEKARKLSG
jgi:hypothetical protein